MVLYGVTELGRPVHYTGIHFHIKTNALGRSTVESLSVFDRNGVTDFGGSYRCRYGVNHTGRPGRNRCLGSFFTASLKQAVRFEVIGVGKDCRAESFTWVVRRELINPLQITKLNHVEDHVGINLDERSS